MPETNFSPNLGEFMEASSSGGPFPVFSFPGTPSGAASEGAIGIDESTGDFYQYSGGTWTLLFSGGGSGSGGGESGSGSPEGVVTANPGTTYWDATNEILYVKDSGTGTNTGWVEVIA